MNLNIEEAERRKDRSQLSERHIYAAAQNASKEGLERA